MKLQNVKQDSISPRWHLPEGITSFSLLINSLVGSMVIRKFDVHIPNTWWPHLKSLGHL